MNLISQNHPAGSASYGLQLRKAQRIALLSHTFRVASGRCSALALARHPPHASRKAQKTRFHDPNVAKNM